MWTYTYLGIYTVFIMHPDIPTYSKLHIFFPYTAIYLLLWQSRDGDQSVAKLHVIIVRAELLSHRKDFLICEPRSILASWTGMDIQGLCTGRWTVEVKHLFDYIATVSWLLYFSILSGLPT